MNHRRPTRILSGSIVALTLAVFGGASAHAANFYWDPGLSGAGTGSGGAGTWNLADTAWYNGTADVAWSNGNTAIFAGTGGAVAVGSGLITTRVTFESPGYTLTGFDTLTINGATPGFVVGAGASAVIDVPVSIETTNQNTAIGLQAGGSITFTQPLFVTGKTFLNGAAGSTININAGGALQVGGTDYTEVSGGVQLNFNSGSTTVSPSPAYAFFVTGGSAISVKNDAMVNVLTNARFSVGGTYNGVGAGTDGTLNISGGTLDLGFGTAAFIIAHAQSGTHTGTVNLDAGTLALNRAITKGSGTAIFNFNGGTLKANGSSMAMAAGAVTTANVRNGGVIIDSNGTNVTIGQALTHSNVLGDNAVDGGLKKLGDGTLTLSGANTYTGATTVITGTLLATVPGALSGYTTPGKVTVGSGATLAVNAGGAGWTSANIDTLRTSALYDVGSALGISTANGSFTYASNLAGTPGLTKLGANTLTLTGSNNYTGPTIVTTGTLLAAVPSALSGFNVLGQVLVNSGASLAVNAGGAGQWSGADIETLATNSVFSFGSTLGIDTTGGNFTQAGNLTGVFGLTKLGTNTLTLSGTNSYSGPTLISAGTVAISASENLGDGLASNTITLGAATLRSTSGTYDLGASRIITQNAASFLAVDAGHLTVSGRITGNKDLTATGAGTLTLSGGANGARSQVAQLFLQTANVNFSGFIDTTSKLVVQGNSTVNWTGTGTNTGSYTGIGDTTNGILNLTAGTLTSSPSSGTFIGTGAVTATLNVTGGSFIVGSNTQIQIGNSYNGGGSNAIGNLNLSGTGIFDTGVTTGAFVLGAAGANTNTGKGTINLDAGGTLATNRSITKGASTGGAGTINFNGGTLKANGNNLAISGLTAARFRDGGAIIDTNGFSPTIAQSFLHSNTGGDNAIDGGLTKIGEGTLILGGTGHTYTGLTKVEGGRLLITGALTGSDILVNNLGSALAGTGAVGDVTVGAGAILMPGTGLVASGGLTSSGNVEMDDGSTFHFVLGSGNAHTTLTRTGSGIWEFDSNQGFTFADAGGANLGTYQNIITGLTGSELGLNTIATWQILTADVAGTFSYDGAGGVDLVLTAVPEPSTVAVMLSGLGLMLGLRRSRRQTVA